MDLSSEMVALAQKRVGDRATVIQGNAEELPFDSCSFDAVYSNLCLMVSWTCASRHHPSA
jgi:ubiquinone/menaquinone biosynthesis C-methylase UbiE